MNEFDFLNNLHILLNFQLDLISNKAHTVSLRNKSISAVSDRIQLNISNPSYRIPISKKFVISLIESIFRKEKKKIEGLIVNFLDDKNIKKINKKYLNHNYNTDIITFDYSEGKEIDGELFISLDTIRENSEKYDVQYHEEFKRVIIHGCLHLSGYDDKSEKEKELIRNKENFYINVKF